MFVIGSYNNCR